MPCLIIDHDVICMKCKQSMIANSDRCGEPNCNCRKALWMHEATESIECESDS